MLLYDHHTESLWSQVLRKAVTGPLTDTPLKTIPVVHTTWKEWKKQHPETLVLSPETGYRRDYNRDPYGIAVAKALGVVAGSSTKAYPFRELAKLKEFPLKDQVGNQTILVYFNKEAQSAWATDESGQPVEAFVSYLDSWKTFFPDTETYRAGAR